MKGVRVEIHFVRQHLARVRTSVLEGELRGDLGGVDQ